MRGIEDILFDKQIESCRKANARINIWEGSVSSGKTYCSIWKWLSWLKNEAPARGSFLMVGKTERTLERNIIDPIQEMIGEKRFRLNKGAGLINFYGRTIYIAGANDERSENKIRGLTLAGAYGDEVTLWPEAFFKMLLSRLRVKNARFYGTTNPDSPFHWLKTEFLDREDVLNLKRFKFLLYDNTTLDPDYVKAVENEYQGLWHKRFILGEWCQAEGAIYDMYVQEEHVLPPEKIKLLVGNMPVANSCVSIDYGTANPTAVLYLQSYKNGYIYVADEYYYDGRANQKQKTDSQLMDDIASFFTTNHISRNVPLIIDPSAASLKAEARGRGFRVFDADNRVLDGIRVVGKLLGDRMMSFSPKCKNLQKEMTSYVWDTFSQKRGKDVPKKENDHCCDSCRYGVMFLQKPQSSQGGFSQFRAR